jgi:hypothetical protein
MSDPTTNPGETPSQRKYQEYEDPHYHDEDADLPPGEETELRTARAPGRRKAKRRPPPRRHYEE